MVNRCLSHTTTAHNFMPNILNSPLTPYPSPLYLPPPPAYPLKLLNTIYSIFNAKLDTFEYHTIN